MSSEKLSLPPRLGVAPEAMPTFAPRARCYEQSPWICASHAHFFHSWLTGLTRSERPVLLDSSARQRSPRGSPSSVFRLGLQIRTSGTALSLPAAGLDRLRVA